MASTVQRELDQTRQELRKGVLDLPQETTETAEAVRRVVSDQILRAEGACGARVRIRPQTFDVAEPAPAVARTGAQSAGVPARFETATARAEARASRSPLRRARPRPFRGSPSRSPRTRRPRKGKGARSRLLSFRPSRFAIRRRSLRAPPATPATPADRAKAGWLSNLLAAASRDEPEAAEPHGVETLDALTQEIANLIDNVAAMEMWERWRRGDAPAASRRLYTEAGQQAFDEIRRRYRAEPQFRETATRYMQEFERLLARIGQNDRDGSQWRAYMLSNTGKVYTILAHAAGRLG